MTVMLFNTVIPLSSSGIKVLSSQSVLFTWGEKGEGRGQRTGSTQNNEGFAVNYRSAARDL